jgi:hypothetical protein
MNTFSFVILPITESMGPVTDHALEHLAPSDQMITRTRRRLLMAARALRDNNVLPPGVEEAEVFRRGRSGYFVSEDKSPWQDPQRCILRPSRWLHRYNWHRPHGSLEAKAPISRLGLAKDNLLRLHG